jgi:hypothetical protein
MSVGGTRVVYGTVDTELECGCVLTKHRKCHVFLACFMLACSCHDSWKTCIRLSHEKAESEFPTLIEILRSSWIFGGWRRVYNQTQKNYFPTKCQKKDRFPPRAVGQMMMMTMMTIMMIMMIVVVIPQHLIQSSQVIDIYEHVTLIASAHF